jgi:hypothetical protein
VQNIWLPRRAVLNLCSSATMVMRALANGRRGPTTGLSSEVERNRNGSWTTELLYNFTGGDDGMLLGPVVIFDDSGKLLRHNAWGRKCRCGSLLQIVAARHRKHDLVGNGPSQLPRPKGRHPSPGGVISDKSGNLPGTTTEAKPPTDLDRDNPHASLVCAQGQPTPR